MRAANPPLHQLQLLPPDAQRARDLALAVVFSVSIEPLQLYQQHARRWKRLQLQLLVTEMQQMQNARASGSRAMTGSVLQQTLASTVLPLQQILPAWSQHSGFPVLSMALQQMADTARQLAMPNATQMVVEQIERFSRES